MISKNIIRIFFQETIIETRRLHIIYYICMKRPKLFLLYASSSFACSWHLLWLDGKNRYRTICCKMSLWSFSKENVLLFKQWKESVILLSYNNLGETWAKSQILSDLSFIAQAFQSFSFYDFRGQNISEMT